MTKREDQKKETKVKIFMAIGKLGQIYGIENLKVRQICQEAQISIGTFYNYFDSIEAILVEFIANHQYSSASSMKEILISENEILNMQEYLRLQVKAFRKLPLSLKKEIFKTFLSHPEIKILEVNRTNYSIIHEIICKGQAKNQITKRMDADTMTKLVLKILIGNCFVNSMHVENHDFFDQLLEEVLLIITDK